MGRTDSTGVVRSRSLWLLPLRGSLVLSSVVLTGELPLSSPGTWTMPRGHVGWRRNIYTKYGLTYFSTRQKGGFMDKGTQIQVALRFQGCPTPVCETRLSSPTFYDTRVDGVLKGTESPRTWGLVNFPPTSCPILGQKTP